MAGNAESHPLQEVWACLGLAEARELLELIQALFGGISVGQHDSGWHVLVGVAGGPELTVAPGPTELEPPPTTSG